MDLLIDHWVSAEETVDVPFANCYFYLPIKNLIKLFLSFIKFNPEYLILQEQIRNLLFGLHKLLLELLCLLLQRFF